MIVPTKHLAVDRSLIAVGAVLLEQLQTPLSVSRLWEEAREAREVVSYDLFTLGLSMLFGIGAVTLTDGVLQRSVG